MSKHSVDDKKELKQISKPKYTTVRIIQYVICSSCYCWLHVLAIFGLPFSKDRSPRASNVTLFHHKISWYQLVTTAWTIKLKPIHTSTWMLANAESMGNGWIPVKHAKSTQPQQDNLARQEIPGNAMPSLTRAVYTSFRCTSETNPRNPPRILRSPIFGSMMCNINFYLHYSICSSQRTLVPSPLSIRSSGIPHRGQKHPLCDL